jgi:plastocyanin
MRARIWSRLLPVCLLVVGCGGSSVASGSDSVTAVERDGVQSATLHGTDALRFVPSTVRAKPGRIELVLDVTGGVPHNLEVDGVPGAAIPNVAGHEVGRIVFSVGAGRYQLLCTYHPAMRGVLVVAP